MFCANIPIFPTQNILYKIVAYEILFHRAAQQLEFIHMKLCDFRNLYTLYEILIVEKMSL